MSRKFTINKEIITEKSQCYFVAEIGANHCGNMKLAKDLIDMCKLAGASAVKLQKRSNKNLFTKKMYNSIYYNRNSYGPTYGKHRESLELTISHYKQLKKYAAKRKILLVCTPFDEKSLLELESINIQAYKIASADITNLPLISKVASTRKPTFMSTGASSMKDVELAYRTFTKVHNNLCIMQCTSIYPPKYDQLNLNIINTYKEKFKNNIIGLSSHESGIAMDLVAYVMGARVIEKHVTLNRAMKGTDHAFSLELVGLKKSIQYLTNAKKAFGSNIKKTLQDEKLLLKKQIKSIVASRNLNINQTITHEDVCFKVNGGDGLNPTFLNKFLGKKIKCNIFRDQPLYLKHVKN
jgi:N-acetylneuraminate synthase/sialic acid synthase